MTGRATVAVGLGFGSIGFDSVSVFIFSLGVFVTVTLGAEENHLVGLIVVLMMGMDFATPAAL
jgi:hypothetical protein